MNVALIEKKILDQIFSTMNYDKRIIPRPNNTDNSWTAVNVTASMHIRSLIFIDERKQTYGMEVSFRQEWTDDRLKFDDANKRLKYLTLYTADVIWIPILFFETEVKGFLHNITMPNTLVRIYPNGKVLLNQRFNLKVGTEFNYQKFPFDRQDLELNIHSQILTDDMNLRWQPHSGVTINNNINLPIFTVETIEMEFKKSLALKPYAGYYSHLVLQITVAREFNYYLNQIFVPCTMFVVSGYLGFWLDIKFMTARIILGVSTLYTLATMINTFNSDIPKVSYIKLVDYFTGISLTFVFLSLIELVIAQAFEISTPQANPGEEQDESTHVQSFNVKHVKQWLKSTPVNKIDAIFRIAYPTAFIAFLISYALVAYL